LPAGFASHGDLSTVPLLFYSEDFGEGDSSSPWSVVGFEAGKYFSLGPSARARQRVIALNLWTTNCISWNDYDTENGEVVFHRPPTYKGANLGGLWRMKGYPATRFHDRAAIYYSAEYRHTLNWNPFKNFTLKGRMDVDWFQVTAFTELGRVSSHWGTQELYEDLKWTVGGGIRTMVNNIVIRADLVISEEGSIVQLFIGHPF